MTGLGPILATRGQKMRRFIAILAVPAVIACTHDASVAPPIQLDDIRDDGTEFPGVSKTINCDPAPKLIFDKHGEIVDEVYPILHPSCNKSGQKSARPSVSVPLTTIALGPDDNPRSNDTTGTSAGPDNSNDPNTPAAPTNPNTPTAPTNPDSGNPNTPSDPNPTTPTNPDTSGPDTSDPDTGTPAEPNPATPTNPTTPITPTDPGEEDDHGDDEGCSDPDPCHDHEKHNPLTNDSPNEIEKYHPELLNN